MADKIGTVTIDVFTNDSKIDYDKSKISLHVLKAILNSHIDLINEEITQQVVVRTLTAINEKNVIMGQGLDTINKKLGK